LNLKSTIISIDLTKLSKMNLIDMNM